MTYTTHAAPPAKKKKDSKPPLHTHITVQRVFKISHHAAQTEGIFDDLRARGSR